MGIMLLDEGRHGIHCSSPFAAVSRGEGTVHHGVDDGNIGNVARVGCCLFRNALHGVGQSGVCIGGGIVAGIDVAILKVMMLGILLGEIGVEIGGGGGTGGCRSRVGCCGLIAEWGSKWIGDWEQRIFDRQDQMQTNSGKWTMDIPERAWTQR